MAATTTKANPAKKAASKRAATRKRTAKKRAAEPREDRPRYAAYLRISSDRDGRSTAPDRQLRDIRRHAQLHEYDIVEIYKDSDLSAYKDVRRPAYEEMLGAMEEGAIDGVVVWKLDRLIRRITEFSRFWEIADRTGTALVSVKDAHVDTRQPIGVGIVYLLVSLAEQEAFTMGMRIQAKKLEEADAGQRHSGGRRGYGMDREGNIIESEAEVIREAAARALAGENLGHIARDFNRRGIPTAAGRRWARRTIHVLLQQARLFGWREHRGELTKEGDWEPILDEATGRKLRELLPFTPRGMNEPSKRVHLLSGILRCRICDRAMRAGTFARPQKTVDPETGETAMIRTGAYRCPPLTEGGCGRTSIARSAVDEMITEMVLMRIDSPAVRNALGGRRKTKGGNDAKLLSELQRHTAKAEELAEDYAHDRLSRAGYHRALTSVERQIAAVNDRLASSAETQPLADLLSAPGGLQAAWKALSVERKQAIMRVMLQTVYVHQVGSDYYATNIRESMLIEAAELEAAGNLKKAAERRKSAENRRAGGNQTRPERLEPIWIA